MKLVWRPLDGKVELNAVHMERVALVGLIQPAFGQWDVFLVGEDGLEFLDQGRVYSFVDAVAVLEKTVEGSLEQIAQRLKGVDKDA